MHSNEFEELKRENARLQAELDEIQAARRKKRRAGWWLTRKAGGAFAGRWLRNSFLKLYHEIPEQKVQKETLADVSASLLWRLTRIGMITIFLALLPTAILLFQSNILLRQNKILQMQNLRLDQQTNLQEAERRSSLVFVMSSLMDQMDDQIQREGGYLTDALIARLAGLTQSLKPYRFLENDVLTEKAWSPEKGQLFLSVLLSDMSRNSRVELFKKANFTYSDLKGAEIRLARLSEARLSNSRLESTRLFNCDWTGVDLTMADLNHAWIEGSVFSNCQLDKASATHGAWFDVDLTKCKLTEFNLSGALLHQVVFTDVDTRSTILSGSVLSGCSFAGTTDLAQIDFENTWVDRQDWIEELQISGATGADRIASSYKVGKAADLEEIFGEHPHFDRFKARNQEKTFFKIVKK